MDFLQKVGHLVWSGCVSDERNKEEGGICFVISPSVCMCNVRVPVNVCTFKDFKPTLDTLVAPIASCELLFVSLMLQKINKSAC